MIARQQQYTLRFVSVLLVFQPDIGACNRLYAFALCGPIELDETEQVAQVGECQSRLPKLNGLINQSRDTRNAIHHRELGVNAQMDERGRSGFKIHVAIVLRQTTLPVAMTTQRCSDAQALCSRFTDTGAGVRNSCAKSATRSSSSIQRKSSS